MWAKRGTRRDINGQNGTQAEPVDFTGNDDNEEPYDSDNDSNVNGSVDDDIDFTTQGVHLGIHDIITKNIGQLTNDDGELSDDTAQVEEELIWKVVELAPKLVIQLKQRVVPVDKDVPNFPKKSS